MVAQGGVGEDLAQAHGEAPLVLLGQVLEVDLEGLAKLEQKRDRHRPLVVLDQVEVARTDAKLLRHLLLSQAPILPQPANLVT